MVYRPSRLLLIIRYIQIFERRLVKISTSFPNSIQTFPTMKDMTASDATLVQHYQELMKQGRINAARDVLAQITDYDRKLVTADLLNTMKDTIVALQIYYDSKFSPAYIVSATRPIGQDLYDFWFDVDKETNAS